MESETKLQQLIANIEDQEIAKVNSAMQFVDLESLQQKFENGNTILHYVFSSNTKIIKLFIKKLEILLIKDISKENLRELFQILNDGNFTPVDRIFQNNPKEKIEKVLKGIHNHDILEIFLKAEGGYGSINDIIYGELYSEEERGELLKSIKTGIYHLEHWSDWCKSFIFTPEVIQEKKKLAKQIFNFDQEEQSYSQIDYAIISFFPSLITSLTISSSLAISKLNQGFNAQQAGEFYKVLGYSITAAPKSFPPVVNFMNSLKYEIYKHYGKIVTFVFSSSAGGYAYDNQELTGIIDRIFENSPKETNEAAISDVNLVDEIKEPELKTEEGLDEEKGLKLNAEVELKNSQYDDFL